MSARPSSRVNDIIKTFADRLNESEDLQVLKLGVTVKVWLLFGSERTYFEIDNFENGGVTIALYASHNLHSSARVLVEDPKQYTFKQLDNMSIDKFLHPLNALNGFFR